MAKQKNVTEDIIKICSIVLRTLIIVLRISICHVALICL